MNKLTVYDLTKIEKLIRDYRKTKIYEITQKYSYDREIVEYHLDEMNKKLKEIDEIVLFVEENLVD